MTGHVQSGDAALSRLIDARQAFEWGRPVEVRRDLAREIGAAHLLTLSTLLSLDEISVILAAEALRDQALALVRQGDMARATDAIRRSATLCEAAALGDHARTAARSFHSAAVAYLIYRQGRHPEAIHALEDAIRACDALSAHYDGAVEFRRVHLARNILRVQCRCVPTAQFVAGSIDLLFYIGGDASRWPFDAGRGLGKPARLTADQRAWQIDETIISLALAELNAVASGDTVSYAHASRDGRDAYLLASFEWCAAMIAVRSGNRTAYLHHAANFFDHRPYALSQATKLLDAAFRDARGML